MTRAGYGGGSLRRRGDRKWELRVSTGRDPVKGRYGYVSRTVRGTRKEAEGALAALVTQVNAGIGGHSGSDATVAELVEQGSTSGATGFRSRPGRATPARRGSG